MSVASPPHPSLPTRSSPTTPDQPPPVWAVAELFPRAGQWTEHDYLHLSTSRLVELSNGSIEVIPMATRLHQAIAILFLKLLRAHVAGDELALVLIAPFSVRLWPGQMRQPDVLYMSGPHADRQHETHWDGADLAIEIVSDDDPSRDWELKRREYAVARIPEYWVVDPRPRTVTVLRLDGDAYAVAGTYAEGDVAASVLLPGFVVAVTDVFNAR